MSDINRQTPEDTKAEQEQELSADTTVSRKTADPEPVRLVSAADAASATPVHENRSTCTPEILSGYVSAPVVDSDDERLSAEVRTPCPAKAAARHKANEKTARSHRAPVIPGGLRKILPGGGAGLLLSGILSLGLGSGFAGTIAGGLLSTLPLQIYWSLCLLRLCRVIAGKSGKAPMTPLELTLLSLVAYVTHPYPVHHSYNAMTCLLQQSQIFGFAPLFPIFWLLTQAIWPMIFVSFLQRNGDSNKKANWLQAILAGCGANAYLLFSAPWTVGQIFFEILCGIFQLSCMFFLAHKLEKRDSKEKPESTTRNNEVSAGDDIVIPYRSFAGIERWRKQQEQAVKRDMRTILWIAIPVLLICYCVGLSLIMSYRAYRATAQAIATLENQRDAIVIPDQSDVPLNVTGSPSSPTHRQDSPTITAMDTTANTAFITVLGYSGAGLVLLGYLYVLCQPTHLGLSRTGWRYLWRQRFINKDARYVRWKDILSIYLDRPRGKTAAMDQCLCFRTKRGKVHKLKLACLDALENRELLLKCLEKFAATVSRSPDLIQALQPPAQHSYTELWLQALSAPPKRERLKPLAAGVILQNGAYKVLGQLGAGGQGQAYLASDTARGGKIVLKEFILPVFVDGNVRRAALEQFENEACILKALDHRQIVRLVDVFIEDHRSYLVLEHINGKSLRETVKATGKLKEDQVRKLALQMCEILGYLHSLKPPVVHRDFTPDNLILNNDGTLKLIDFNVARQVVESTTSGTIVGKHAYLPPEQFRGMPECPSDIYAMGASLHFLLTGQDPVPISVSHPKQIEPELSDSINKIIEQSTALDLQKRYVSIQQLKTDLMGNYDQQET